MSFNEFARYLASHGLRVLTYDYRGIAGSGPSAPRYFRATPEDRARFDVASAQEHMRSVQSRDPVVVVRHGFGAQLRRCLTDVLVARPWPKPREAAAPRPSDRSGGFRSADIMADLTYGRT